MSEKRLKGLPALVLGLGLLAASPAPLVVGTVRDQHGVAIAGATVTAHDADGRTVHASTDADGTFAIDAGAVGDIEVSCRYCRTMRATVAEDGTAVAIVQRYDALQGSAPTSDDLRNLPYTHVESSLALAPFSILENATQLVPGPQLTSTVLEPSGGLLVQSGIADYDPISALSPFLATTYDYTRDASVLDPSFGAPYGDRASNGLFLLDPSDGTQDAGVFAGSSSTTRLNLGTTTTHAVIGYTGSADDQRRRVDVGTGGTFASGSMWLLNALSEGSASDTATTTLGTGFSGLHAGYRASRGALIAVDAAIDRGSYEYDVANVGNATLSGVWSDASASATASSVSGNGVFGSLVLHESSGGYQSYPAVPIFDTHLDQWSAVTGAQTSTANGLNLTTAVAAYGVSYENGNYVTPNSTYMFLSPFVRITYAPPNSHISFIASGNGGYRAATFLERFALSPTMLPDVNRDGTVLGSLVYSDGTHFTASIDALNRSTTGFQPGTSASLGGSLIWQIEPQLSLRAWWMHAGIDVTQPPQLLSIGPFPQPVNVGSAWLTYSARSGVRVDAIWRQDALNYTSDAHLDGDVTGPLASHMRWSIGTEEYLRARSVTFGVRYAQ